MPTVPSQFVPQVDVHPGSQVPLQAPGVESVRNASGEQQARFGQAMTRAGNMAWDVGSDIADAINEAGAKEADTAIQGQWLEIMHGQNGYMNTAGKDAETNFENAKSALSQSASSVIDNLPNEVQKTMVKQVTARNLNTYNAQINKHRNDQAKVYLTGESVARAQVYTNKAADSFATRFQDLDYETNAGVVLYEARVAGRLAGYADDSWQMKQIEQVAWSGITDGVVSRLALTNQFETAKNYVEDQNKAGRLDTKTADKLLTYVDSHRDAQVSRELANSIYYGGILKSGSMPGSFAMPITDPSMKIVRDEGVVRNDLGVSIDAKPGTPVFAPTDAVVTSVRMEGGKTDLLLRARDGSEIQLLNVANDGGLIAGMSVGRGQTIGSSVEEAMVYSIRRDGNFIDPMQTDVMNPTDEKHEKPGSEREAIYIANGIKDVEVRESVVRSLKNMYNDEANLARQDQQYAYLSVMRELATPVRIQATGKSPETTRPRRLEDLPTGLLDMIPSDELDKLMKKQLDKDEDAVLLDAAQYPARYTVDYLLSPEVRGKLTPSTLVRLVDKANDPAKILSATVDADQLNETLYRNGLNTLANPKAGNEDQVSAALYLRTSINDQIDAAQQHVKRKLTTEEVQSIIDKNIINRGTVGGWMWDSVGTKPIASLSRSEQAKLVGAGFVPVRGDNIPLDKYKEIYDKVKKATGKEPTDYEIWSTFQKLK